VKLDRQYICQTMEGTDRQIQDTVAEPNMWSDMLTAVTTPQAVYGPMVKFLKQYKLGSDGSDSIT